jgi:hypothetical protein
MVICLWALNRKALNILKQGIGQAGESDAKMRILRVRGFIRCKRFFILRRAL